MVLSPLALRPTARWAGAALLISGAITMPTTSGPSPRPFPGSAPRCASRLLTALLLAVACLLPAAPATAQVEEWAVHGGVFDLDRSQEAAQAGLEARLRVWRLALGSFELPVEPAFGAFGNEDGAAYVYTSFRIPLAEIWPATWPRRWRVVPFTGVGLYEEGDSKDLGGPVEFRSGLDVDYRLGDRWWLGVSFYHLSNGVLYDLNPGEESLVLQLSWR
jgi:hypothetical protein